MTYKGDPLAQKLDQVAEATGFPRLQRRMQFGNPVRFRVMPMPYDRCVSNGQALGSPVVPEV